MAYQRDPYITARKMPKQFLSWRQFYWQSPSNIAIMQSRLEEAIFDPGL